MAARGTKTPIENEANALAVINKLQGRLRLTWLAWLAYRAIGLPILLNQILGTQPNIVGGMVWQLLWLIPALLVTPWLVKGKSPYMLLVISMLTLVYLGASGVTVFERFYDSGRLALPIYLLDTLLILLVNVWLFKLLKKLPSMNGPQGHK